jgi:uncharacterized repeat protein (TIGR01451 family)
MNKFTTVATAGVLSVAIATSVVAPAYAWHPKGVIVKSVQNVTANGTLSDANTPATAVSAKPGDVLNYVIEVKNVAKPAQKQYNDMDFTVVTDTLPAGVELMSDPSKRSLSKDLGLIVPGASKKYEFQVKVTETTDGKVITNKACFTGDSVVKDNPQKGCDDAVVKLTVPPTPVTPQQPAPPAPTPEQPLPEVLPESGASAFFAPILGILATAGGYFGYLLRLKRRVA